MNTSGKEHTKKKTEFSTCCPCILSKLKYTVHSLFYEQSCRQRGHIKKLGFAKALGAAFGCGIKELLLSSIMFSFKVERKEDL